MNSFKYFLVSTGFVMATQAFSHGENKPGPNGGYIRMPGAFHTEVVPEKSGYRIYLLDINWKNPSVKDSTLTANIEIENKKNELSCSKSTDSFFCKSDMIAKGKLNILAQREGQTGGVATYNLPLKFETPNVEANPKKMEHHHGH